MDTKSYKFIIIGAGMAGLTLAGGLQKAGVSSLILEKSRGLGGRMATRRVGEANLDHGAQFFTAKSPEFQRRVEEWKQNQWVHSWFDQDSLAGSLLSEAMVPSSPRPRWVGSQGMTTVPKALAEDLLIERQVHVVGLERTDLGWRILGEGRVWETENLVITAPVPQALELLEPVPGFHNLPEYADLNQVDYHPCLAFMAVFECDPGLPSPGYRKAPHPDIAWMADNRAKGISPTHAVTVHSSPDFARRHWDSPDDVRIPAMLESVGPFWKGSPTVVSCHRWRYGELIRSASTPALWVPKWKLGLCGDGFTGGRVEGAWLSAQALLEQLGYRGKAL